ncbi:MAG: thioesterase [Betaproteobacteria bacterium]|nr:thioesterase [Betaproteobacteria bacterium]
MRAPEIGRSGGWDPVPGDEHTAHAVGNSGVHVVSTPHLIGFLEMACHYNIVALLEPGEATVGTRVEVEHVGAALPGRALECRSRLEACDGRKLMFSVRATQDGREIMRGRHERAVVNLDRFLQKLEEATGARLRR